MNTTLKGFKSWSVATYTCLFGAVFGYTTFGGAHGEIYLWIIAAFVGSMLMALKNAKILDMSIRRRVQVADIGMILLLIALMYVVPASIGLLKTLIVLAAMVAYLGVYMNFLFQGKLGFPSDEHLSGKAAV
jgi:hypothetical protein